MLSCRVAWDPAQYLKFADHRLRPAIDLLNRVALEHAGEVYDLGAGAGNVTRLIKERWPEARVTGVDDSPAMLAKAAATAPAITWQQADLATWSPPRPADLIYSNAALHWLTGHERLFPALLAALAPAGVLAVQMPRNFGAPSHTLISEAARGGPWRAKLEPLLRPAPVADPDFYYDAPRAPRGRPRHLGDGVPPDPRGRPSGQGVDQGHLAQAAARRPRGAGAEPLRGALCRAGGPRLPPARGRAHAVSVPAPLHRGPGALRTA